MTMVLHDVLQTATFRDDTSETVEGLVEKPCGPAEAERRHVESPETCIVDPVRSL
jgi:hypothetical protein